MFQCQMLMEYCIIVEVTGVSVSNADGVLYYCGGDWCFSVEC